ncbi:MAG: putative KAP-like P-loop ATPase, partial [Lysobacterales bacterium]
MTNPNLREAPLTFQSSLQEGHDELQHDTLKLLPYAHALRDFIHECETPMTIGVQGDWGIGKTSLMNMLRGTEGVAGSGLLNQERCKVISFETWLYSQFNKGQTLAIACMHSLTTKISEILKQSGRVDIQAVDSLESNAKSSLELVLANIRDRQNDGPK